MAAKMIARFTGVFLLVLGVCYFIPGLTATANAGGSVNAVGIGTSGNEYRRLLSLFPMNGWLSLLFVALGAAGVAMSLSTVNARRYAQSLFIIALVLLVLAILPFTSTGFGVFAFSGFTTGLWFLLMMLSIYPAFLNGPMLAKMNEPVFRQAD